MIVADMMAPDVFGAATATVRTPVRGSRDAMGIEAVTWASTDVPGCLWAPGATSDLSDSTRPDGHSVTSTLHVPKSCALDLEGAEVDVAGRRWRVVGAPMRVPADTCPGPWNCQATLEAFDG